MEAITITKRVINGQTVCNKRFDDYDKGFYGIRISQKEYNESKNSAIKNGFWDVTPQRKILNIVEQITYNN